MVWILYFNVNKLQKLSTYFNNFSFYYQVYVCLLLVFYFNPYVNVSFTKVKKQMVFGAALMLLFSIGLSHIINKVKIILYL